MARFIVCVSRQVGDVSSDDLTIGKLYEVVDEKHGTVSIVDDSGEEYIYPSDAFVAVQVEGESELRIHEALQRQAA